MMRIDTIASRPRYLDSQMPAGSADPKAKNIQNKITDARQQVQTLSSKEDLTADEKAAERKKLQRKILGLNTRLRQYKEDLRRAQKRELLAKEQREDAASAEEKREDGRKQPDVTAENKTAESKTEKTGILSNADGSVIRKDNADDPEKARGPEDAVDAKSAEKAEDAAGVEKAEETEEKDRAGLSGKRVHALVSADSSAQQADQVGTVILRTKDGIVILKGEIEQDERYGSDTQRKQEELEKRTRRVQRAQAFQSSLWDQANNTLKAAAETHKNETQGKGRIASDRDAHTGTLQTAAAQASQPEFHVSFR